MTEAQRALDGAMQETERLLKLLTKSKTVQIRSEDERVSLHATSLAWFNTHRPQLTAILANDILAPIDSEFKVLLAASDKLPSRSKMTEAIKRLRKHVNRVRSEHVVLLSASHTAKTADASPDFGPLIGDPKMQEILTRRWAECVTCIGSGATLAATVMMGGLLEGLLLARVNKEPNKKAVFTAKAAPKDKQGATLGLKDWMLKDYIDVGHELKWITVSARDVGVVLRDYRNYIHPQKELSHSVQLIPDDALLLWEITKSISRQVIKS